MAATVFPKLRGGDVPSEQARALDNVDAVLRPVAQALSRTPIMGVAPVWTRLPLAANFTSLAGYAVAAYYKDSLFRVWAKGVLQVDAAGAAPGTTIGFFPPGFRVAEVQRKAVEGDVAAVQFVSLWPDGRATNEVAIPANGFIDFDFSFLAEQ